MRMKFNRTSQLVLVSAASLLAACLVTACGTLTVDFVYVTSAYQNTSSTSTGLVDVFEINSESGRMRQIPTSPFPSGGRNPVAEAVSTDYADLYVVNRDDNTIVQFAIGNDGKLYPQNTYNTPGVFPMAVNVTGSNLYVVDTYQPLPTCSTAAPCSGSIAAYPINKDDSLATPVTNAGLSAAYWPLTLPASPTDVMTPTAVTTAAAGAYVYVTTYDSTSGGGYIFGFKVNSDGTLAPMNGGVPFAAGVKPSAIAADPSGNFVYVTDAGKNQVLTFAVNGGLLSLTGSPAQTGNVPAAIVVDRAGKFAYVANSQDGNLSAFTLSNGVLGSIGTYTTGAQPVAIGIDPSLNEYLYTANFLDATVTGFQINATDGTLLNSQFSPSKANTLPTAVAAIPHGSQLKK